MKNSDPSIARHWLIADPLFCKMTELQIWPIKFLYSQWKSIINHSLSDSFRIQDKFVNIINEFDPVSDPGWSTRPVTSQRKIKLKRQKEINWITKQRRNKSLFTVRVCNVSKAWDTIMTNVIIQKWLLSFPIK